MNEFNKSLTLDLGSTTPADGNREFQASISQESNTTIRQNSFGKKYIEVLPHTEDSIDWSAAPDGKIPLLFNHDKTKKIGTVTNLKLDPVEKKLTGTVRFGKSALAQEILADVQDGNWDSMSFGYRYNVDNQVEHKKIDGKPYGFVKKWTPYEASMVIFPQDPGIGINKALTLDELEAEVEVIPTTETVVVEEVKSLDEVVVEDSKIITDILNEESKAINPPSIITEITNMENQETVVMPASVDFGKDKIMDSYSIQEHIKGYMNGNITGAAREVSQELGELNVIPVQAFTKAFTTNTATGGAEFNIPKFGGYLDLLLPQSVFGKLGCTPMNLTNSIVLPGADTPTPGDTTEAGVGGATGDPVTRSITFDAKIAIAQIPMSKKSLFQSEPGVDSYLMNIMLRKHRYDFEKKALAQILSEITNTVTIGATNVVDDASSATLLNVMKAVASVIDMPARGTFLTNWNMFTKLASVKRSATLTLPVVQNGLIWDLPTVVSAVLGQVAAKDPVIFMDPEYLQTASFGPGVCFEVDSSSQANALKGHVTITSQCFWDAHVMNQAAFAKAVNAV